MSVLHFRGTSDVQTFLIFFPLHWESVFLSCVILKEGAISSLKEWLSDSAIGSNPVLRLIAGIIFMHEQDYNEALKHTHSGGTLDLYVLPFPSSFWLFRLSDWNAEPWKRLQSSKCYMNFDCHRCCYPGLFPLWCKTDNLTKKKIA